MKYSIEDVRKGLEGTGWKVISDDYKSLDTEMIFECPEGHGVYASWQKIRQKREGRRCKETYIK